MQSELIGQWVIVRTYSAGVFFGRLKAREGKEAIVEEARRLWFWAGAASLSQMANEGTNRPEECKFPAPVSKEEFTEVIEVLPCTERAIASIRSVPEWRV